MIEDEWAATEFSVKQINGQMPDGEAAEPLFMMRIPENLALRAERAAKAKGQSFNDYAMRALEDALREDGRASPVVFLRPNYGDI